MSPPPLARPTFADPGLATFAYRQLFVILLLLTTLTMSGTVGLRLITGADWFDCLYMAVITLTTVGYHESVPLGTGGRLFIIGYLVCGVGIFTFSIFTLGQWVVNARMQQLWQGRRMQQAIDRMEDHFIVCGIGRMGNTICEQLHLRKQPFVVVESSESRAIAVCERQGWPCIIGDATDDETLIKAGVRRARALASVLPTDADNVYVVLSARMLASDLQIIARASDEKAVEKLERAGATRVVSPFASGAMKMARFMLTPSIEDFLDIADGQGDQLELADVQVTDESPYIGRTLAECDVRRLGVMILGIRRASGERLMPPPPNATLRRGDSLFAFGSAQAVNEMLTSERSLPQQNPKPAT